ncbi:16798_t:CDS:2, partial [Cetraspora pellucida]
LIRSPVVLTEFQNSPTLKSKTVTSHVNKIFKTMTNTSANGFNSKGPKGNNSR